MRASRRLTSLLTLLLAACQPGTAEQPADTTPAPDLRGGAERPAEQPGLVELRTDRTSYRPGGEVTLTLVNHGPAGYTFNPCFRTVQRQEAGAWDTVRETDRVCTMQAWMLEPGATRTAATELPPSLPAGRYRLLLQLTPTEPATPPAEPTTVASPPFTIEP